MLEKRRLGKTGEKLSILGFGGIIVMNAEQSHANKVVAEAVDRGINYFDVAPTYGDAQDRLGPALEPYRKDVFLACKTTQRNADEAEIELHQSLEAMRTDHFDLYQMHALNNIEETKTALGKGGAIETFLKARQQGLIRFIGFSTHDVATALFAIEHFDFDTVLFPCNYVMYQKGNFGPQIRDAAKQKDMGMLALKSMARTHWPEGTKDHPYPKCWYEPNDDESLVKLALRFTLSEPVTALLPPGEESFFRLALDFLEQGFAPLSVEERKVLESSAENLQPLFETV